MVIEAVGIIKFDGVSIEVYDDLNNPLFRIQDVAKIIGYRQDSAKKLLNMCEDDEYLIGSVFLAGQRRNCNFVTEMGLYNILPLHACGSC